MSPSPQPPRLGKSFSCNMMRRQALKCKTVGGGGDRKRGKGEGKERERGDRRESCGEGGGTANRQRDRREGGRQTTPLQRETGRETWTETERDWEMQRNKKKREAESRELERDTQRDGHTHRNRESDGDFTLKAKRLEETKQTETERETGRWGERPPSIEDWRTKAGERCREVGRGKRDQRLIFVLITVYRAGGRTSLS